MLRDDEGSATVIGVAVVAALVSLTVALLAIGSAVLARHRAVAAADLAALAGASVLMTGTGEPCPTAVRIARAQVDPALRVDSCAVDGEYVLVAVSVPVSLGRFGIHTATARARAGPLSTAFRPHHFAQSADIAADCANRVGWKVSTISRMRSMAAAVAALALALGSGPATAQPVPQIGDARTLVGAARDGGLLGVPALPDLAGGAGSTLSSPEFWSNWVHEAMRKGKFLLPLPTDVIKPDVFLPHQTIRSGVPAPLPRARAPFDIGSVTYRWAGRTKSVRDFVRDTQTDALLLTRGGRLVGEYYANGYQRTREHHGWSMTKSFVSTLIGIAVDEGKIKSLDDPIEKYIPNLRRTAWQGTTIRNILWMRSGVKWDEHTSEIGDNDQFLQWIDLALDYQSGGRIGKTRNEFLRALPRVSPQGSKFNYNSGNTQVLGWLLESVYRQPLSRTMSQKLWRPTGLEADGTIVTDRTGAALASMSLFARPADFLRFGELMHAGGVAANGRRVVSSAWVTEATTNRKPAHDAGDEHPGSYGYQWWSGATPRGFQANGFQGQYLTIVPESCVTGLRLAHMLQMKSNGDFAGQGNDEWQTLLRAVSRRFGGCGAFR